MNRRRVVPCGERTRSTSRGQLAARTRGYAAAIRDVPRPRRSLRAASASLLSALPIALAVLAGCSGDDAPPDVTEIDALDVGEGPTETCLRVAEDLGPMVTDLPVVSCSLAHTHEIYFVSTADPDAVYPGLDALEDTARVVCLEQFSTYVGRGAFDSRFFYTWIVPSIDTWNDSELQDRETLCLLSARDNSPLVGSQRLVDQ